MRISSIGYIIKQGFKNIFTNKMFSLASIATISPSAVKTSGLISAKEASDSTKSL